MERRRPHRTDMLIAGVIGLLAQIETWTTESFDPKLPYAVAALAIALPLAWRRVAPIPVMVLVVAPLYAMAIAGNYLDAAYIILALIAAFAAVGSYCPDRRSAVAGLVIGLAAMAVLFTIENEKAPGEDTNPVGDLIFVGGILGGVWVLAVALRERTRHADALEDRAQRLEREREERARQAVAEERARIARELHDVVAHSVSVIAVQTGSMRRRLRHDRPAEAEELAATEQTARQALAEMRRMLGLLRSEDDGLALTPQPGIGEVERLVEQTRNAGVDVRLDVSGDPVALAPGVDLAAYRIVQEALTNVIKHAGPAHARVEIQFGEREIELEVSDDGRGPSANGNGGGHGLVGMRERVALYGGSLEAAARPEGGFAVRARLPIITA